MSDLDADVPNVDEDGLPKLGDDPEKNKEIEELRKLVISERGHCQC